jgi:predicted peroxiredoxin
MAQEVHVVLLSNDPNRAYPALSLILAARALGHNASLYCAQQGLDAIRKDKEGQITLPGYPPLSKFVRDAIQMGAYVCACAPSKEILEAQGIRPETVLEGVRMEDAVTFLSRALEASKAGGLVLMV